MVLERKEDKKLEKPSEMRRWNLIDKQLGFIYKKKKVALKCTHYNLNDQLLLPPIAQIQDHQAEGIIHDHWRSHFHSGH